MTQQDFWRLLQTNEAPQNLIHWQTDWMLEDFTCQGKSKPGQEGPVFVQLLK